MKYLVGILIVVILAESFYFYRRLSESDLILENKKIELRKSIDSITTELVKYTEKSNKKFDSILNIPPKFKWKKYEVPTYIDRTLDDALNIHAEYKTNSLPRE